jgi:hypothetical protein
MKSGMNEKNGNAVSVKRFLNLYLWTYTPYRVLIPTFDKNAGRTCFKVKVPD